MQATPLPKRLLLPDPSDRRPEVDEAARSMEVVLQLVSDASTSSLSDTAPACPLPSPPPPSKTTKSEYRRQVLTGVRMGSS